MSINCDIVKDLFVLYHDDAVSPETKKEIDEHLEKCSYCHEYYKSMNKLYSRTADKATLSTQPTSDVDLEFTKVAKKLRKAKTRNIILTNALVAISALSGVLITMAVTKRKYNK